MSKILVALLKNVGAFLFFWRRPAPMATPAPAPVADPLAATVVQAKAPRPRRILTEKQKVGRWYGILNRLPRVSRNQRRAVRANLHLAYAQTAKRVR